MDEDEYNFNAFQKQHQENIRVKLTKFTSNEISFFNAPFPQFFDFNDELKQQKSLFISQFANYSPCFDPKLFSDRIRYKFSKDFKSQDNLYLIKFFQTQIEHIKWRNEVIYNRISKPNTFPIFSKYYPLYLDSTSEYSENCTLAIQNLQSESPNYRYIESIIKYDYYHHFCHFQIDNLLYIFKKFPLIRRKEILSIVKESLVNDLIFDLNTTSIPTVINQTDDLMDELKRLSSLFDIEFDIYAQDGQHFSYSCEKLYFKIANQSISFNCNTNSIPEIKYPSFLDRLNDNFIKKTKIDESISFAFDNLVSPSEIAMDTIMKKFSNPVIKELTKDKVIILIRLQFCRNKEILHSIVKSIKSIEKVAKEILNEDLKNFFDEDFSIFRKITLVVASSVKSNSNLSSIDNDSLLEIVLDLYDKFYKYKVKVLNALLEINMNSQNIDISAITKKFIEFRPDLIAGNHKSCIQPFKLSVNILKQISTAIQILINLQILTNNEFKSLYGNNFPWFEFPETDKKYQQTNDSFPHSIFEVFPFLSKVVEFLHVSREVVMEATESFSVRSTRYKPYFEYAIWTQLLNEMNNFITNLTPESYVFKNEITEKVSMIMTSPYLNDLNFILKVINEASIRNKFKFVLNFRNMIFLGWKLQSFLTKSDACMKTYKTQLSKLENNNTPLIIDFAYGDYDFSAISNDWNSIELEKITNAQHRFQVALEVAVRFNNYHLDVDTIQTTLEMNQYEVALQPKATMDQINRYKSIKMLPSLLFYEPELIDEKLYSATSFCYITAAREFTDAKYVTGVFLPYCIRSEITFISILERCFLHSYSSYDVFYTSDNPRETFINMNNNFNHFLLPTIPQALLLDRNEEIMYQVLRFVSIRYQLLKYTQHDTILSRNKANYLLEIYEEKFLWSSNLFPTISFELHQSSEGNNVEFAVNYLNKEREVICSKQLMNVFTVLDLSVAPKKEEKKRRNEEAETFSFESVKSYFIDINRKITGSSSFMNSSLYTQTYLDQFFYQCNDALKIEFENQKSMVDKQVIDSVVGYSENEYNDAIYDFTMNSIRFSFMRLGLFYLYEVKDPKKVTIDSIPQKITKEMILKGIEKYDGESKIQATYRTNMNPSRGTVEMNFLKSKIKIIIEQMETLIKEFLIQIFTKQFQKETEVFESIFNSPTSVLKPECYAERIPMKSSQQIFIPPIPSIKNQFAEEVQYARSQFCRMLCHCISKSNTKNDNNESLVINTYALKERMNDLSEILSVFFDSSRFRLIKTWKGYIQNLLFNFKKSTDEHENMNVFIDYFINRFNSSVQFNLAHKLKENYIKIAHLRDQEKVINQEHERFEKQEIKEIRKEFEILVRDLNEEIHKAKLRFVIAKNRIYGASFNAINKIKDDPTYIDKCIVPQKKEAPKVEAVTKAEIEEEKPEIEEKIEIINKEEEKPDNENENSFASDATEVKDDLTETKIDFSASEIKDENEDSKFPTVSFAPEALEHKNTTQNLQEDTEVEAFPSFSHASELKPPNSTIINAPADSKSILLTATDKTAIDEHLSDANKEPEIQPKPPSQPPKREEEKETNQNEKKPTSLPSEDGSFIRPRCMNLRKSSSTNPQANNDLNSTTGNIPMNGRRGINLRRLQSQKMKIKNQTNANTTIDFSNIEAEVAESSSIASMNIPSDTLELDEADHFAHERSQSQHKSREMINNVTDRIEQTKRQIEELQELRKKLRISTTLSALAVKGIYTRRIEQVAEERKNYSANLWRGRRLLEEDLKEQNLELKEAYKRLNNADSQIELLQEEIAKTKEQNVKLMHTKMLNIRQVEEIHKELKKINYSSDVNVSQLLKKISAKQEELEYLNYDEQQFQTELYYEVTEPMMELDQMRRELTIRRAQTAEENYLRTQMLQQQQEVEENLNEEEEEEVAFEFEQQQNQQIQKEEKPFVRHVSREVIRNRINSSSSSSFRKSSQNLSLSEQISWKVADFNSNNELLRKQNENLRNQIKELEEKISEVPNSRKKIIKNLQPQETKSAKPKSHKTVVRPGFRKTFKNSKRLRTSKKKL